MDEAKIRIFAYRKLVLSLTLLLFLLTASRCVTAAFASFAGDYTKRVEINAIDKTGAGAADARETSMLMLENMSRVSGEYRNGEYRNGLVSWSSSMGSWLKHGLIVMPVKVELTDAAYIKFSDLKIIRGTYFSEAAYDNGRNVAVINEQMAYRLFTGLDAVGNEVELFNEKYKVVGVYKEPESVISLMGSDGAERVYVPFTSFAGMEAMPVDTVYISDSFLEKEKFRENKVESFLKSRLGINTALYRITGYYNAPVMAGQAGEIFVFFAAVWCICVLVRLTALYVGKNVKHVRDSLKEQYAGEFLMTHKLYISRFAAGTTLLAALVAGMFFFALPHLHIPARYIPQENIFDMGFYWNIIKSAFVNANSSYGYVPTPLEKDYGSVLLLNTLLLAFAVPAFISAVSGLKLLKMAGGSAKLLRKAAAVSCILAFVLSALFSIAGGVGFAAPLKVMVVMLSLCILLFINPGKPKNAPAGATSFHESEVRRGAS